MAALARELNTTCPGLTVRLAQLLQQYRHLGDVADTTTAGSAAKVGSAPGASGEVAAPVRCTASTTPATGAASTDAHKAGDGPSMEAMAVQELLKLALPMTAPTVPTTTCEAQRTSATATHYTADDPSQPDRATQSNQCNQSNHQSPAQPLLSTRRSGKRFSAQEDSILWDAYVAQNGPALPPPQRCTVRWSPPRAFVAALSDRLQRPAAQVVARMKQLFTQYHWSRGRFRQPKTCTNQPLQEPHASISLLGNVSSICSSVGDVSIPKLDEQAADCDAAAPTLPHVVATLIGSSAQETQRSGLLTPDPARESTLLVRRSGRKRQPVHITDASSFGAPLLHTRDAEDDASYETGDRANAQSETHLAAPRKRRRLYSPVQDQRIWDTYQDFLRRQQLGSTEKWGKWAAQLAGELGRAYSSLQYRLRVLQDHFHSATTAATASQDVAHTADLNERADSASAAAAPLVDPADALDRFLASDTLSPPDRVSPQPAVAAGGPVVPAFPRMVPIPIQELSAASSGNLSVAGQRSAEGVRRDDHCTAANSHTALDSTGRTISQHAASASEDGVEECCPVTGARDDISDLSSVTPDEADDAAWRAAGLLMPYDRMPFTVQEDALLMRKVVEALHCCSWIAEADGTMDRLMRSPPVLAERARGLLGTAIDRALYGQGAAGPGPKPVPAPGVVALRATDGG